ncbi:hypothetical protein BKA93DRAFT_877181 [Sparassis latifolia]
MDAIISSELTGGPHIPILPQKVVDRIIDFLLDDQQSLCDCALTCRAWFPRSRQNLYDGNMEILNRRRYDSLVPTTKIKHLEPLVSIRSLTLRGLRYPFFPGTDPGEPRWIHLFSLTLGELFSGVVELTIAKWTTQNLRPSEHEVGFPCFSHIHTLRLHDCDFRSSRELERLLASFTCLGTLIIKQVDYGSGPRENDLETTWHDKGPRLCCLGVATSDAHLLDWLRRCPFTTSLRDLSLDTSVSSVWDASSRMVQALGPTLEVLRVTDSSMDFNLSAEQIDLSRCSSLRTLKVTFRMSRLKQDMLRTQIPTLLERIPATSRLQTLQMVISLESLRVSEDQQHYDWTYWRNVDRILAKEHFCKLNTVNIRVIYDTEKDREDIESLERQKNALFPELSRHGKNFQMVFIFNPPISITDATFKLKPRADGSQRHDRAEELGVAGKAMIFVCDRAQVH